MIAPNMGRSGHPTLREVLPRLRTGWALDRELALFGSADARGIVSAPSPLQHHKMAPDAHDVRQLLVPILTVGRDDQPGTLECIADMRPGRSSTTPAETH